MKTLIIFCSHPVVGVVFLIVNIVNDESTNYDTISLPTTNCDTSLSGSKDQRAFCITIRFFVIIKHQKLRYKMQKARGLLEPSLKLEMWAGWMRSVGRVNAERGGGVEEEPSLSAKPFWFFISSLKSGDNRRFLRRFIKFTCVLCNTGGLVHVPCVWWQYSHFHNDSQCNSSAICKRRLRSFSER